MHYCIDCSTDPSKNRLHRIRDGINHFGIALLLVLLTPYFLSFVTSSSLEKIRAKNPSAQAESLVEYSRGKVQKIVEETPQKDELNQVNYLDQKLEIVLLDGKEKNAVLELQRQTSLSDEKQKFVVNDQVVIRKDFLADGQPNYFILDKFRLDSLVYLGIGFFFLVVILAGFRGLASFLGLVFSLILIIQYLIPEILAGQNLFWVTFVTSLAVALVSLYLAHGFSKKTTVSVVSTIITIAISSFIAVWIVDITKLTGGASEDTLYLQTSQLTGGLNLRGLLLSGIIIGTLGVLDDVTTAQAAAVSEISKANPKLSRKELFWRGMAVGQEHVISLVNTLALAYAGSSLPLLLLFSMNNYSPIWVTLNNEMISSEIVRTLIGSICLLLAIPISTLLSAKFLKFDDTETINKVTIKKEFSFAESISSEAKKGN